MLKEHKSIPNLCLVIKIIDKNTTHVKNIPIGILTCITQCTHILMHFAPGPFFRLPVTITSKIKHNMTQTAQKGMKNTSDKSMEKGNKSCMKISPCNCIHPFLIPLSLLLRVDQGKKRVHQSFLGSHCPHLLELHIEKETESRRGQY